MTPRPLLTLLPLALLLVAGPLAAGPGWSHSGWGASDWRGGREVRPDRSPDGKVEVASFRAAGDAGAALGHGAIVVAAAPGSLGGERELATYEAAVVDRLVHAGYQTTAPTPTSQVAELRITHTQIEAAAPPHRPVSGAMTMGVSNRGSMMGMAVNVDMRKPLPALVGTRLETRIRDRAGTVLWEGRADIATREGDPHWTDQALATRLAEALFARFPAATEENLSRR